MPDSTEVEAMWASRTSEGYKIDNIPFYARGISAEDIVSASPDADGMLRFGALVVPGQHSTIRLWFAKDSESEVDRIRQELRDMGCSSELSDLPRLVAVDIPPTVPYHIVKNALDSYETEGVLEYEESCLAVPSA